MNYVLDHTGKPYAKLFEDISAIPRGSFKEEKIADFVCNFAIRIHSRQRKQYYRAETGFSGL